MEDQLYDCDRVKKLLMDNLIKARDKMKLFAGHQSTERSFEIGDRVLLKLQPYRQSTARGSMSHKLSSKYYGLYTILEKIGSVTYRLQLPPEAKIHDIFHVSQLKRNEGMAVQIQCDPPSFWEVKAKEPESILERRMVKRGNCAVIEVLIKWKNEDVLDATCEDFQLMRKRFPGFNIMAKVKFRNGGMSGSNSKNLILR